MMRTSSELIDWVYEIYVQTLIPDEIDPPGERRGDEDCNDDKQ